MRVTVLGGCGAWPTPDAGCSGYLVESHGYRLLLDPGYATLPRLLGLLAADEVDAVLVSHGHPDHCADLNPLLRARSLADAPPPPLPVYALPGAIDAVLALDPPSMSRNACVPREIEPGRPFEIGPLRVATRLLPHFVPNVGVRLSDGSGSVSYTGDCGPDPAVVELSRGTDVLLAEATYVDAVPGPDAAYLTSARQAGAQAALAGVGRLVLTHLWPGTDPEQARGAASRSYPHRVDVARPGLVVPIGATTTDR